MNMKRLGNTVRRTLVMGLNRYDLKQKFYPLAIGLLLLFAGALRAQDAHYSQFYQAPALINPALTGIYRGDVRFMANYRSQWHSVPVDYNTFTAFADMKFIQRTDRKGFFSGGLAFNYDYAGDSKLALANLNASVSYTQGFSSRAFGTIGFYMGGSQRAFKPGNLRFENQFDPEQGTYNPDLNNGENFDATNIFFVDFGAGINFRLQSEQTETLVDLLDKRNKLDVGVGIFHLNRPNQSFYDNAPVELPVRISPYASATLMLGMNLDLVANFTGQFQQEYRELVGMAGVKIHFNNRQLGRQFGLQLGAGYRFHDFGDAFFPGIELYWNGWNAGFTYDINISEFSIATRRRGGPEFSLRYIINKIRPLPSHRVCPLI